THFGLVSGTREPFLPHDDVQHVMRQLARTGYATSRDAYFLWTDKIARAMRLTGLWDERNRSLSDIRARATDDEMRAAVQSIPEDVRQAACRDDVLAVWVALSGRWTGGAWKDGPSHDAHVELVGGVGRVERLIDLVKTGAGRANERF